MNAPEENLSDCGDMSPQSKSSPQSEIKTRSDNSPPS